MMQVYWAGCSRGRHETGTAGGIIPDCPPCAHYSFNETGSDSFFGEFLFKRAINSLPAAGTPTLPSRTISFALRLRPYSFLLALPSERSVEPSNEMPANKPRVRE